MEAIARCGDLEVKLKASALVPRLYRYKFGRDLIRDMNQLSKSYSKAAALSKDATEEERLDAQLSVMDLTIFENVAYIMAKHADAKAVPDTADEWLESLPGVFSVYENLPVILELWQLNQGQTSTTKKK